nr:DUF3667 domain-containing protein [Candidatus Krumholzibacteria bacterium]
MENSQASPCPNCGAEGSTPFCGQCGQDREVSLSVGHWLGDTFREMVSADGRFWLTVRLLLLKPGKLDLDWARGRRERYMSPTRLYLLFTALFFFVSSLVPEQSNVIVDFASGFSLGSEGLVESKGEAVTSEDVVAKVSYMVDLSLKWILILGLVPALAGLTRVLFGRRGDYYASYLVASLHTHSVLYVLMIVLLLVLKLVGKADDPDASSTIGFLTVFPLILVYFARQSRRIYRRGRASTLVRGFVVVFAYSSVWVAISIALSVFAGINV